jgi:hypothetical protein
LCATRAALTQEWYEKVHKFLLQENLTPDTIAQSVPRANIVLREGVEDLIDRLQTLQVPFLLFSAGKCLTLKIEKPIEICLTKFLLCEKLKKNEIVEETRVAC